MLIHGSNLHRAEQRDKTTAVGATVTNDRGSLLNRLSWAIFRIVIMFNHIRPLINIGVSSEPTSSWSYALIDQVASVNSLHLIFSVN